MVTTAAVTATAGFYDLEQVRQVLGQKDVLQVKRLIARGNLPASRIGQAGPWRVAEVDVTAYIRAGCPDLRGPELDGEGWDMRDCRFAADTFEKAIQFRIDEAIRKGLEASPLDGEDVVEVKADDRLRASAAAPADVNSFTPKTAPTWLDRATAFFAQAVRRRVVTALPSGMASDIYDSPESYTAATSEALRFVAGRFDAFRASLPVKGKPGSVRSCQIRLLYADLFTPARQRAVLLSGF